MPRPKKIVDTSNLPKIQCVNCNNFHIFTDFSNTRKKDENGQNVRREVCKYCIYGHIATGRDSKKMHLNAVRHRCKVKGMAFDLTLEDLEIPATCPILGIALLQKWGEGNGAGVFNSPSVDKIIPSLGYVKGNVQIISNRANLMKTDASIDDICNLLKYMEANLGGHLKLVA